MGSAQRPPTSHSHCLCSPAKQPSPGTPSARATQQHPMLGPSPQDSASSLTADNLERLGRLGAPRSPPGDGTLLSEAKLQSVMSFLDEMERSGRGPPSTQLEVGTRQALRPPRPLWAPGREENGRASCLTWTPVWVGLSSILPTPCPGGPSWHPGPWRPLGKTSGQAEWTGGRRYCHAAGRSEVNMTFLVAMLVLRSRPSFSCTQQ